MFQFQNAFKQKRFEICELQLFRLEMEILFDLNEMVIDR